MQVTGGRNGYGAKLTNIFSTEFIVETCDGQRGGRYKQVVLVHTLSCVHCACKLAVSGHKALCRRFSIAT